MNTDVETVLSGLQTYLQAKVGSSFQTLGRRVRMWTDVEAQPALFIRHVADEDQYEAIFDKTEIDVEIWIYAKADAGPTAASDTTLNGLVKAVRDAFKSDSRQGKFTIGGLVDWCRIHGRSEFDPGEQDGQGKAVLSVRILLP